MNEVIYEAKRVKSGILLLRNGKPTIYASKDKILAEIGKLISRDIICTTVTNVYTETDSYRVL